MWHSYFRNRRAKSRSVKRLGPEAGNIYPDTPEILGTDEIQRLGVGIAERKIGEPDSLGSGDFTQAFSRGRNNPQAACGCGVDIALAIDADAIRSAQTFFASQIQEQAAILHGVVGLDVIGKNLLEHRGVGYVQGFFVWRKGDPIGRGAAGFFVQQGHLAGFYEVESVEGQFLLWTILSAETP